MVSRVNLKLNVLYNNVYTKYHGRYEYNFRFGKLDECSNSGKCIFIYKKIVLLLGVLNLGFNESSAFPVGFTQGFKKF